MPPRNVCVLWYFRILFSLFRALANYMVTGNCGGNQCSKLFYILRFILQRFSFILLCGHELYETKVSEFLKYFFLNIWLQRTLCFRCWITLFCTKYLFHVILPCQNSETQIFCLDFRLHRILGVRNLKTQMCFRNFLLPIFWVSEFRKPKCVFAIFYYPYFGCPNFGNPNVFSQFSITHILGVRISETQISDQIP